MSDLKTLEVLFHKHACTDYKWIDPRDIIISQWVRMKCMFGCGDYGRDATCPPNVPSVSECRRFFEEYTTAVIFHFAKAVEKPEDRFSWSRKINEGLVALEREIFLSGYRKAFVLVIDSCTMCKECTMVRDACRNPRTARPTPEAMAVDVYTTVRKHGYPIQVLTDYSQTMNRYGILLVE
jgi:predicted metal-binding protein